MSTLDLTAKKNPYKKTDYRYELWKSQRKLLKEKAKRDSYKVQPSATVEQPKTKGIITIDTSKARSNSDVIRLCLKQLGWREVIPCFCTLLGIWSRSSGTRVADTDQQKLLIYVSEVIWFSVLQYPCGKKDGGFCDITWHSVQFYDTTEVNGGVINKLPGLQYFCSRNPSFLTD